MLLRLLLLLSTVVIQTLASEPHWAQIHLASEHHIDNYDADAFFMLHDTNYDNELTHDELLHIYGVDPNDKKYEHIWVKTLQEIDKDGYGKITREAWKAWSDNGGKLQDYGTGVGHHGDAEHEYEIHHFEKFHSNDKEDGSDMVIHPEDLEHYAYHEAQELEAKKEAEKKASDGKNTVDNKKADDKKADDKKADEPVAKKEPPESGTQVPIRNHASTSKEILIDNIPSKFRAQEL